MGYRKFSADRIFDGHRFLEPGQVLITDETGLIRDIVSGSEAGDEVEGFRGILSPGLINCHCHLELSHLKSVIPPHTGLVDFLVSVVTNRSAQSEAQILEKIAEAENEMLQAGTAGVADICNTEHSVTTKATSRLRWHNLIEVLNLFDGGLPQKLAHYQSVAGLHRNLPHQTVLTPHAPYTISEATWQAINEQTAGQVISVHNQETAAEDELFQTGGGDFLRLFSALGISRSPFPVSGKSSLQTYLPWFTNGQTILLVHNTFTRAADIAFARRQAEKYGLQIIYCLCPNANLYIENRLPPVSMLVDQGCTIVLGTDSYSSNWQLSIASELHTLQQHFPQLPLETLLQWATRNGAAALGWSDLGVLKAGLRPGLTLLHLQEEGSDQLSGTSQRIL